MRKIFTLFLILISVNTVFAEKSSDTKFTDYPGQIDSMYYLIWNKTNSSWNREWIRHYKYTDESLESLLLIDGHTRDSVWLWNYFYNDENNRNYEVLVKWNNYISSLSQKKESEFINGKKVSELLSNWKNGIWIINTKSIFEYSSDHLIREIVQIKDKSGLLYNNQYINYIYEDDLLRKVTTQRVSDGVITKIQEYYYNANKFLKEIIYLEQVQTPTAINPEYQPVTKRTYSYDEYMLQNEVLFENWENNSWILSAKYVYFRKIDFAKKVSICHNGNTIIVSVNAVKAHLAHGDQLGKCSNESLDRVKKADSEITAKKFPFTIYPNPVSDRFTVKFIENGSSDFGRIEIIDPYGKLVRSFILRGENEISIPRGNLKSGQYYIKLTGKEIYGTIVIFE